MLLALSENLPLFCSRNRTNKAIVLETELTKKLLYGETVNQAEIQMINALNKSQEASSGTILDFLHKQYKETLSLSFLKNITSYFGSPVK